METRKRKPTALSATLAVQLCLLTTLFPSDSHAESPNPTPSDQRLYPLCDDLVPARVRQKYLAGMAALPQNMNSYDTLCEFASEKQAMSVVYRCIHGESFSAKPLNPKTETAVSSVGRFAYRSADKKGPILTFADDDTPCLISLFARGEYQWDSMPPLARDLAAAATPTVVERRTIDAQVVTVDDTGLNSEDLARMWKIEETSLKYMFKFAPGLPQNAELPSPLTGDRPRKAFVLGYCGRLLFVSDGLKNLQRLYPTFAIERLGAEGRELSCPHRAVALGYDEDNVFTVGEGTVAVAFGFPIESTRTPPTVLLAYLRDPKHRLLDWKGIDLLKEAPDAKKMLDPKRPEQEHSPLCGWSVKSDQESVTASVLCERNPDPQTGHVICKQKPSWSLRWTISVQGDKLKIQRKRIIFRGKGCAEDGE